MLRTVEPALAELHETGPRVQRGEGQMGSVGHYVLGESSVAAVIARQTTMALLLGALIGVGATSAVAGNVYWVQSGSIYRAAQDGTHIEIVLSGLPSAEDVEFDPVARQLYWTETDGKIRRADLSGSNVEDVVTDLDRPTFLALDVVAQKLYWTDCVTWGGGACYSDGRVRRANFDGSDIEDIVNDDDLQMPFGIALNLENGRVFFTNFFGGIYAVDLDGTNLQMLNNHDFPTGIALDVEGYRMYYGDLDDEDIWRANLDGSGVTSLISTSNAPLDLALDLEGGQLYFSGSQGLSRADLDGSNWTVIISVGRIRGIALDLLCGNGEVDAVEECDDGNNTGGDGCAADCTLEVGDGVPAVSHGGAVLLLLLLLTASTAVLLWRRRSAT